MSRSSNDRCDLLRLTRFGGDRRRPVPLRKNARDVGKVDRGEGGEQCYALLADRVAEADQESDEY